LVIGSKRLDPGGKSGSLAFAGCARDDRFLFGSKRLRGANVKLGRYIASLGTEVHRQECLRHLFD
jgi:hypothetical protein